MAEPTRYRTLNGLPPTGGVPPNRMFVETPMPPPPQHIPDPGPPNRGNPPPLYAAYGSKFPNMPTFLGTNPIPDPAGMVYYPDYQPYTVPYPVPAPYPVAAVPAVCPVLMGLAPPPAPAPAHYPYEPPGQWVDGHQMTAGEWSFIGPKETITINFLGDGSRPCDYPGGFKQHFDYSVHKVPCNMHVRELMTQLEMPEQGDCGLTEMIEVGGNIWQAGDTFTNHGVAYDRTLGQFGWTSAKGTVWLCVKR